MSKQRRYIPVPMELRHFDLSDYLHKGIKDITDFANWVEGIVEKIDRWNEVGDEYDDQSHDLMNELLQFSSHAMRNVRYAMYKDKDVYERLRGRIANLERELKYSPPEKPKSNKKVNDAEKAGVAKIAALMK